MDQEKKITVRFDLTNDNQRELYDLITKRDHTIYKSQSDYIYAAVRALEDQNGRAEEIWKREQERLCDQLIERLADAGYLSSAVRTEPGR